MTRKSKRIQGKKKWFALGGAAAVILLGLLWWKSQSLQGTKASSQTYTISKVTEGKVASSTLLSGSIKAQSEQYVYFDATKGSNPTVTVNVGDQVSMGQQVVQYDTTAAQAAYDQAVRNYNKIGRQITSLKTTGVASAPETSVDESTGQTTTSGITTQGTYQEQLQALYDAQADAQGEVDKAQIALNNTSALSEVNGTVVEINNNIDPTGKSNQAMVHITSEGKLEVEGTLTEYDLANIKVDQAVKIKSKVYPDKEWDGKITYISNYPSQSATAATADATASSSTSSSPSYEYKAELTSDLGDLKQGFTVSVEVVNDQQSLVVPVSALVSKGDKNYVWLYDKSNSRVLRKEVTAGDADAKLQEILTGLEKDQEIITNPDNNLKEGKKIDKPQEEKTSSEEG